MNSASVCHFPQTKDGPLNEGNWSDDIDIVKQETGPVFYTSLLKKFVRGGKVNVTVNYCGFDDNNSATFFMVLNMCYRAAKVCFIYYQRVVQENK